MPTIPLTVIKKNGTVVASVLTLFNDEDFIGLASNGAGGSAFKQEEGLSYPVAYEVAETPAAIQTLLGYAPTSDTETVLKKKFTLSAAQLLALFTTPLQAIAAPGAGKTIELISAFAKNTFGTAAFVSNALNVHYESNVGAGADVAASFTQAFMQTVATKREKGVLTASHNVYSNKGIFVAVPTVNPTTGDGSVDIYIEYRIVTE